VRILILGLLELVLGILWGFIWSLYSTSLVNNGFNGVGYGVLGLIMSLATFLAYTVSSLLYYLNLYTPIMPLSATLIGFSYYSIRSGVFLELTPIAMGFALGSHTISTIRTSTSLSGNPKFVVYVYSLSLLGFSLGSLAVVFGHTPKTSLVLLIAIITGILYRIIQGGGYSSTLKFGVTRTKLLSDLKLAIVTSLTFICVALVLGSASGLSSSNIDYYMIVLFNAREDEVALMFAISGLIATLISLASLNVVKGDPWRIHALLVLAQTPLLVTITLAGTISYAITLYAMRTALAVLSDAVFDTIYTRAPPTRIADLRIPLVVVSWELANGIGKLVGSITIHVDPVTTITLGCLIMASYSMVTLIARSFNEDKRSMMMDITSWRKGGLPRLIHDTNTLITCHETCYRVGKPCRYKV